jgi:hypothetical protein
MVVAQVCALRSCRGPDHAKRHMQTCGFYFSLARSKPDSAGIRFSLSPESRDLESVGSCPEFVEGPQRKLEVKYEDDT